MRHILVGYDLEARQRFQLGPFLISQLAAEADRGIAKRARDFATATPQFALDQGADDCKVDHAPARQVSPHPRDLDAKAVQMLHLRTRIERNDILAWYDAGQRRWHKRGRA